VHGKVLHVGDTQEMQFKEGDDLQAQDYIGKQKGIFQILFERGLYIEVMIKGYTPAQLNEKILNGEPIKSEDYQAAPVMEGLPDFLNEKSALEEIS
jgi:AAA15 family ATPase/GTPase